MTEGRHQRFLSSLNEWQYTIVFAEVVHASRADRSELSFGPVGHGVLSGALQL